jgi:hypothetical protein
VLERIDGRLAALEERLDASREEGGDATPKKRRVPLSDAAQALELSRAEEAELRRIYEETFDKACALLATESESAADVRRDLEASKGQPGNEMKVLGKYMGRFMGKIPDFIALGAERDERIQTAIGPTKASRLEREFDVEEGNPLGFGSVSVGARSR